MDSTKVEKLSCPSGVVSKYPAWASNKKPSSIIQTIILTEMNAGFTRRTFDWDAHMITQLHQSRANCQPEEGSLQQQQQKAKVDKNKKKIMKPSIMTTKPKKGKGPPTVSPHFELKASFLELIDSKFIQRLKGHQGNIFTFSHIEPALSKETRTSFCLVTGGNTQFGKFDVFYNCNLPIVSAAARKSLHPTLFLIPHDGKSLQLYSLLTGGLELSMNFGDSIKYNKVTFYEESGSVLLNSRKSTLPMDVFDDILQLSYPPLSVIAHIQVKKSAVKKSKIRSLEYTEDYFLAHSTVGKDKIIILYDLEKLLSKSKSDSWRKSDLSSPSHVIEEFTDALFKVKSCDSFLSFDHTESPLHYLTKQSQKEYALFQLTRDGSIKVQTEKYLNLSDDELPVIFLRNYGPRILTKDEGTIRIWAIVYTEVDDPNSPVISTLSSRPLFEKNYNDRHVSTNNGIVLPRSCAKDGLREIARNSYQEEDGISLETSENEFVKQLTVVLFSKQSVEVYIYDSYSYALQYKINPHVFGPTKYELDDRILVDFTDNFVAVHKISSGQEKKIYTFNLLRGLL